MYNMCMAKSFRSTYFGGNLRRVRLERGKTLQNMADALKINLRSYQNYESGDREPSLSGLATIAQTLDVSIDHLLGLTPDAPPFITSEEQNHLDSLEAPVDE